MAHRDLASRIPVRNAAESGQSRTDAKDPERTLVCAAFGAIVYDLIGFPASIGNAYT